MPSSIVAKIPILVLAFFVKVLNYNSWRAVIPAFFASQGGRLQVVNLFPKKLRIYRSHIPRILFSKQMLNLQIFYGADLQIIRGFECVETLDALSRVVPDIRIFCLKFQLQLLDDRFEIVYEFGPERVLVRFIAFVSR